MFAYRKHEPGKEVVLDKSKSVAHPQIHVWCTEYLQHREARGLIEEVQVLCVEWRRQDRSTWTSGPRLKVMQE